MSITLYHNPKCSKSRQTKALLEEHNIDFTMVLYLETPPSPATLTTLLKKLNLTAEELIRKKEPLYKELGLDKQALTEQALIALMSTHPKLIERPIVVTEHLAAIGRPPEKVLELF